MSHGGAREGSGAKRKYTDAAGNPLPTKKVWIPEILTEQDIQRLVAEKTKNKDKSD